ncbi:MAG: efflux RND transporter permease subunit, partial [Cyanobacteria bacterium J06650_10]
MPKAPASADRSVRSRFNISKFAIQHSKLTVCFWLVIAVAGMLAFSSLKYALFPDVTFPVVVVNAITPVEDVITSENTLSIPLEQQLSSLENLKTIASSTTAGRSVANLRFRVGTALDAATAAVEEAITQTNLPADTRVDVIPLNLNEVTAISYALTVPNNTLEDNFLIDEPTTENALSGSQSVLVDLSEFAKRELLPPLQTIPGVLRVDLVGSGIILNDQSKASAPANPQTDTTESFLTNLKNAPQRVRFNRQAALAIQVVKRADANTLEVTDRVGVEVQRLRDRFPDMQLTLAATQADYIRAATRATIDSLLAAIAIAVLVIFLFLRSWRATLITILAIPLSLLGTCIVMAVCGFNLETITLLALALVIGIIVDDAIVEIENITRHIEQGASPRQAALIATQEIGLTVSASTLTIVAVFLPVAFMGGTVGQFFKPFGLTVSAAVLISLLVARTLSPVLATYWLKSDLHRLHRPGLDPVTDRRESDMLSQNRKDQQQPVSWLERRYHRLLAWSLRHRGKVVGIAIASFAAGIAVVPLIPQGFIPQLDRGEFYLNYTVEPPSAQALLAEANLEDTANSLSGDFSERIDQDETGRQGLRREGLRREDISRQLLQRSLEQNLETAQQLEETIFNLHEVSSVLAIAGDRGRPNQGSFYIKLEDGRDRSTAAIQAQLRQDLPKIKGVTTSVEDIQFVDTG